MHGYAGVGSYCVSVSVCELCEGGSHPCWWVAATSVDQGLDACWALPSCVVCTLWGPGKGPQRAQSRGLAGAGGACSAGAAPGPPVLHEHSRGSLCVLGGRGGLGTRPRGKGSGYGPGSGISHATSERCPSPGASLALLDPAAGGSASGWSLGGLWQEAVEAPTRASRALREEGLTGTPQRSRGTAGAPGCPCRGVRHALPRPLGVSEAGGRDLGRCSHRPRKPQGFSKRPDTGERPGRVPITAAEGALPAHTWKAFWPPGSEPISFRCQAAQAEGSAATAPANGTPGPRRGVQSALSGTCPTSLPLSEHMAAVTDGETEALRWAGIGLQHPHVCGGLRSECQPPDTPRDTRPSFQLHREGSSHVTDTGTESQSHLVASTDREAAGLPPGVDASDLGPGEPRKQGSVGEGPGDRAAGKASWRRVLRLDRGTGGVGSLSGSEME